MRYTDLNDEQREIFVEAFYECWHNEFSFEDDKSNSLPWGCPWYWNHSLDEMIYEDIRKDAIEYFKAVKFDIELDHKGAKEAYEDWKNDEDEQD